jgi:NADPH-dependent 2,4-dienoyl-CoA reductase/sulfur reductase-like enzyme
VSGPRAVVVGGDAAGMTAASHLRRTLDDADILVVERGPYVSTSLCGIPHLVSGELDAVDELVVRTPEQLRGAGIGVATRCEAVAIDAVARRVRVRDLASGRERDEPYDELLYATGAHPVRPDLPGLAEHSIVVHTLDEGERLRAWLDEHPAASCVAVVGAGYIGMELAEAVTRRGIQALLIDRNTHVMSSLDADMAEPIHEVLRAHDIALHLGERLRAVRGEDGCCREVVTDAGVYPADLVVVALGSRPNSAVAARAGCALGDSGALVVDAAMRTTVDGVWAAGDCVESRHLVSGRPVNVQLGTHANKQGKVAALNMAARLRGEQPVAAFPGVVGTAVTKVCDLEIARTGLSVREAEEVGLAHQVVTFEGSARAGYMPDPGSVRVRMLAEESSGRVLGAQLVGTGNVGKRIDVAATWCQLGVRVQDAQLLDLAYEPPFGGVWDLLQVAARKLTRQLGLHPQL